MHWTSTPPLMLLKAHHNRGTQLAELIGVNPFQEWRYTCTTRNANVVNGPYCNRYIYQYYYHPIWNTRIGTVGYSSDTILFSMKSLTVAFCAILCAIIMLFAELPTQIHSTSGAIARSSVPSMSVHSTRVSFDCRLNTFQNVHYLLLHPMMSPPLVKHRLNTVELITIRIQRLFYIPHLLNRWKGPLSLAVLIRSKKEEEYLDHYLSQNTLSTKLVVSRLVSDKGYPYNALRNIAIQRVTTSHFWVMDMDMWPSSNLYRTLLSLDVRHLKDDYLAVIVPAFEYKRTWKGGSFEQCVKSYSWFSIAICRVIPRLPQTIPELRSCLAAKNCREFRKRDFVHVSSLLFHSCIELSHFRVVYFKDGSTLLRVLLQELQARALRDGETVTASSRVWRAFRELREGQDQLDWASSLHGIQVRRAEKRLRNRHSPSSVVLVGDFKV